MGQNSGTRLPFLGLEDYKAKAAAGAAPTDVLLFKHYTPDTIKVASDGTRRATFVISTGAVDRERDTVAVDGWDTESWLKNPVVLFAHRYSELPVAKGVSLVKSAGQLRATIEWPAAGVHDLADTTYEMVKGGFLRGASVGFRPKASQWNDDRRGMDFLEQELLEFSIVPVPANPEALLDAAKGLAGAIAAGIDVAPLERALMIAKGVVGHNKGSVPPNVSSVKAPEDAAWSKPTLGDYTDKSWPDLSDAEKRHIAGHCAWSAAMPPTKFEDLKLPHHDPKSGEVNWKGVFSAMGALNGARGGAAIPDADKEHVRAHLAAHYRQFGKEPPDKDAADVAVTRSGRVLSQANKDLVEEALGHFEAAAGHHKNVAARLQDAAKCMKALLAKAEGDDAVAEDNDEVESERTEDPLDPVPDDDGDQPDAQARAARASKKDAEELVDVDLEELFAGVDQVCKTGIADGIADGLRRATGRLD